MAIAQCSPERLRRGEERWGAHVAVRDRAYGGCRTRDDHRRLSRDRRLRPWAHRRARATQGMARRAHRTPGRRSADRGGGAQGELAAPLSYSRKGPPKGGPFVVFGLGPEEAPLELVERALQA